MSVQDMLEVVRMTLSHEEQKELVKGLIDLIAEPQPEAIVEKHSLRELRGLGKEIWKGIDAQEYINQQRDEWDTRP